MKHLPAIQIPRIAENTIIAPCNDFISKNETTIDDVFIWEFYNQALSHCIWWMDVSLVYEFAYSSV